MGDVENLLAIREHVKQYHNGDPKVLGRMFALQEQLLGRTGQLVMFVEHKAVGPSQRRMRLGPLCGDAVSFDHTPETRDTKLSVAILTDDRLHLDTTRACGLRTGEIAIGRPHNGAIGIAQGPLIFSEQQYYSLLYHDGRLEQDFGGSHHQGIVEVIVGWDAIVRWVVQSFNDVIPHHYKREWLAYVVSLKRAAQGYLTARPQGMSEWIDCLHGLCIRESNLSLKDRSPDSIARDKTELKELLRRAEQLGYADDPYVVSLKRRYPELT